MTSDRKALIDALRSFPWPHPTVSVHLLDGSVVEGVLIDILGVDTLADIESTDQRGRTVLRIEANGAEHLINIENVSAVASR